MSCARWDLPLTWLANRRPSMLWHCWLGHLTGKIIPKMTYNVLSGTLNFTTPLHSWLRINDSATGQAIIFRMIKTGAGFDQWSCNIQYMVSFQGRRSSTQGHGVFAANTSQLDYGLSYQLLTCWNLSIRTMSCPNMCIAISGSLVEMD